MLVEELPDDDVDAVAGERDGCVAPSTTYPDEVSYLRRPAPRDRLSRPSIASAARRVARVRLCAELPETSCARVMQQRSGARDG